MEETVGFLAAGKACIRWSNPPADIAKCFAEVFAESEFKNAFTEINSRGGGGSSNQKN